MPTVSIVIATYNMAHLIKETIFSCWSQLYDGKEIIVYDDASTDNTEEVIKQLGGSIRYIKADENAGVGAAFNAGIAASNGEIVVLMCADDLFTNQYVINDIVDCFDSDPSVGHVTRWYYQFVNGYPGPVRAWRGQDPILLANNPSGLAFRKKAIEGCSASNRMFVELTQLVSQVLEKGWVHKILPYDAIAVRVHQSTSTKPGYWKKRRVSSPVLDQVGLGAKEIATDFVSLIQIKRGFTINAVLEEIVNFVTIRPLNLLNPRFYLWSVVALLIPRSWATHLPAFYRHRIGRLITKEVKRCVTQSV